MELNQYLIMISIGTTMGGDNVLRVMLELIVLDHYY